MMVKVEMMIMSLAFYQENNGGVSDGADPFSAEGEHYFSYNRNGSIYLISEGYTKRQEEIPELIL